MIVGKIWDSEYPWDVRVEKVCATLAAAGHQVELVCRNRRREPLVEAHPGLRIHRMPVLESWPRRLERASSFPAFPNPRWYRHTVRTFRSTGAEVILCRDLPLAPMALAAGRTLGLPVIVDLAEHYPGLLKDLYNLHDFRMGNLLVRNPWLAAIVERWSLPRADAVWVVVEEMGQRLAEMGVDPAAVTLVSNTPLAERVARSKRESGAPHDPSVLRLVYLGNVERSRGLSVVLDAVAMLGGLPRVTLDVFGDGSSFESDRARARGLGLGDRATFHGRRPYEEILDRLSEFDAGVIPHHATDHWNFTVQNKLFDYFSASLPVLVSSMPPAARIVTGLGAGLVFQDRDAASLGRAILDLADPAVRSAMGAAGRRAVERQYNWSVDGARMVASLERLRRAPHLSAVTAAAGGRPA